MKIGIVTGGIGVAAALQIVIWISLIAAWVHGVILSFSASTVLGIVCLFLPPIEIVFGLARWFAGVDLAARIVQVLPQIFG